MSFAAKQRPPYSPEDRPEYGEAGHGPWCLGLPNPQVPIGANPLKDGTDLDNPAGAVSDGRLPQHRDHRRRASSSRIFVLASLIVTGTLTAIMGSFCFGSQTEYKAVFTSASLLDKGDDVRVAGVTVGEVRERRDQGPQPRRGHLQGQERRAGDHGPAGPRSASSTSSARATCRWAPAQAGAAKMPDGGTIPKSQTQPALNLTELFNGFQPLFQALQPGRDQRPLDEPGQGAPGRGRHHRRADEPHRLADQHPGRPRPAHRRRDRQPVARCSRPSTTATTSSTT